MLSLLPVSTRHQHERAVGLTSSFLVAKQQGLLFGIGHGTWKTKVKPNLRVPRPDLSSQVAGYEIFLGSDLKRGENSALENWSTVLTSQIQQEANSNGIRHNQSSFETSSARDNFPPGCSSLLWHRLLLSHIQSTTQFFEDAPSVCGPRGRMITRQRLETIYTCLV